MKGLFVYGLAALGSGLPASAEDPAVEHAPRGYWDDKNLFPKIFHQPYRWGPCEDLWFSTISERDLESMCGTFLETGILELKFLSTSQKQFRQTCPKYMVGRICRKRLAKGPSCAMTNCHKKLMNNVGDNRKFFEFCGQVATRGLARLTLDKDLDTVVYQYCFGSEFEIGEACKCAKPPIPEPEQCRGVRCYSHVSNILGTSELHAYCAKDTPNHPRKLTEDQHSALQYKCGNQYQQDIDNACYCIKNNELPFDECSRHDCYNKLENGLDPKEWWGKAVKEGNFMHRADTTHGYICGNLEDNVLSTCKCVNRESATPSSAYKTASQTASASSVATNAPPPAASNEAAPPKASQSPDKDGNKTMSEILPVASQSASIDHTHRNKTSKGNDEKPPQIAPANANGGQDGNSTASQTASQATGSSMSPETASHNTPQQTAYPALVSASGAPSSAPEPASLSKEKREELEKRILKVKIEIRGSLFNFQEELPEECAEYNWRVVFETTASRKYTIEICEPSDHGHVVTKVENQLIYGSVVSQTARANSTSLVVENGGLERFEIKQKTVIRIGSLSQDDGEATPREILNCAGGESCSAQPCQGNECDANLDIKYETTKASASVSIKVSVFVACQVPRECNCVRKCAEEKCGVEKPVDRQPSRPIAPEQVRPNTVSVVIDGQTPSVSNAEAPKSPKAPVEQDSVPSTKSQQPAVSHDGEECEVEAQGPKNDGVQPATKQAPSAPQGPQNDGPQPARRPVMEVETETTSVSKPLTAHKDQPEAARPSGVAPANGGSAPSRANTTSTSSRIGEPVRVSGATRSVAGNVLAVVAAMALLL